MFNFASRKRQQVDAKMIQISYDCLEMNPNLFTHDLHMISVVAQMNCGFVATKPLRDIYVFLTKYFEATHKIISFTLRDISVL